MRTTAALIDDNWFARQRIRTLFEQGGLGVHEYEPDRRGIASIDTSRTDVLVMDIFMPEYDGLDFLRQARGHRPELPVVVYFERFAHLGAGRGEARCGLGHRVATAERATGARGGHPPPGRVTRAVDTVPSRRILP